MSTIPLLVPPGGVCLSKAYAHNILLLVRLSSLLTVCWAVLTEECRITVQWDRAVLTEECRITVQGMHRANFCIQGCVCDGGGAMMGWGGVSADHQTDLVTLEGAVAGLQYRDEEPHCTICAEPWTRDCAAAGQCLSSRCQGRAEWTVRQKPQHLALASRFPRTVTNLTHLGWVETMTTATTASTADCVKLYSGMAEHLTGVTEVPCLIREVQMWSCDGCMWWPHTTVLAHSHNHANRNVEAAMSVSDKTFDLFLYLNSWMTFLLLKFGQTLWGKLLEWKL